METPTAPDDVPRCADCGAPVRAEIVDEGHAIRHTCAGCGKTCTVRLRTDESGRMWTVPTKPPA
jgi:hypothetical protein